MNKVKKPLTDKQLHRKVLLECKDCDGVPHGKRCIHYESCRKDVKRWYSFKAKEKTPERTAIFKMYMDNPDFLELTNCDQVIDGKL